MISRPLIYLDNGLDSSQSSINAAYISISWTHTQEYLDVLEDRHVVCHFKG